MGNLVSLSSAIERRGRTYSADSANSMGIRTKPDSEEKEQQLIF